ncbi:MULTISPECIES: cysteine hydrolase family protein [Nitrospirillum]|uniref:Nicotinamidase-related amidase n=1 Tax=Nitrospirillum amazonense TaxID=28077 RepID=A0A560G3D4_9PROT|nr:isochorismatase family cysteine hydrolase [Nitrospirillum amazonense]MEC4591961.1 isochorismatase family cysteine hydrolase [Nitrospirillum amazonense]TWB28354.1 nicotinamidase-related amidase [Nitrospirillum amazonense]
MPTIPKEGVPAKGVPVGAVTVTLTLDPPVPAAALPPMIRPDRTALLVIDPQVDFIAPEGAIGQAGLDLGVVEPTLDRIRPLLAAARAAGVPPVFIRVITRPKTDGAALKALYERRGWPAEAVGICRAGTPGADYYGVAPENGEMEVEKVLFSAFAGTDFEARLRAQGIDTLVVCGFTTECCIDCTVRDAFHRDFHVFIVADACAAYEPALHWGALHALSKNCALLVESGDVAAVWGQARVEA